MNDAVIALRGSLVASGRRLETVASDLANSTRTGHKATRTAFRLEGLEPKYESRLDLGQGPTHYTGQPLDLAIEGPGLIVIDTPGGQRAVRQGHLDVDIQGRLSLAGYPVRGEGGPILRGQGKLEFGLDGTVTADGARLGRLRLVDLPHDTPRDLDGHFIVPPEPAPADGVVRQGFLENTNLPAEEAAIELDWTQHHYRAAARAFELVADDVLGQAIERLGRRS
ncbi:MAG: hypothetical protein AAF533_20335 [Acidobacteriota bacterium]